MKFNNFYVSYKRDTRLLLYWMIKTSNAIIKSLQDSGYGASLELNVTGQVTVSDLVPMSALIVKHHTSVPSDIYRLFQSVIELRSIYHSEFQQLAALSPNEELERNNSTHKYFIDTLTEAFSILGGEAWLSRKQEKQTKSDEGGSDSSSFAFTNKFSALDLDSDPESDGALEDANSEGSDQELNSSAASQKRQQKPSQRKKNKKGKGKKTQRDRKSSQTNGQTLHDVPLESCRIIEDDDMAEYVMAVIALTRDLIQLRLFLQDIWHKVAYENLNSAAAATISNIAVAMIKQSEATIFIDFPGYESYEMIKQTITRGDVEKSENQFSVTAYYMTGDRNVLEARQKSLDIKEIFLIHTYHDLIDFITDYQKTRSGKPTKRMLAQIDNWDPNLNLQQATKEERIKWRRAYTINWLYDLVNVTACVALHGKSAKGENYVFEQMDWSNQGPLRSHRRMFGLIDFAAVVTTLAMQKPGVDFRHRIPPHLVFQLQCIMDAWTVSRGWEISGVRGHILGKPAQSFLPRRDLEIFLGQESGTSNRDKGFFRGIHTLKSFYMHSKRSGKFVAQATNCIRILEKLGFEFLDALGKCKIFLDLSPWLPSRFAATNPNGVWDYSPFFCGAGLAEALELLYRSVMILWDGMLEPMLVVHLHNMLVRRGYLAQPVSLYSRLGVIFADSFFFGGRAPTTNFNEALHNHVEKVMPRKEILQENKNRRTVERFTHTREYLKLAVMRLFTQKSSLFLYRAADWDPDRIPDRNVDPKSALGMFRLNQTRRIHDSATSLWRLEETELVKKTRAAGLNELHITRLDPFFEILRDDRQAQMQSHVFQIGQTTLCMPDFSSAQPSWPRTANKMPNKEESNEEIRSCEMTAKSMLSYLYNDIYGDIHGGRRPLSSLNYIWITIRMLQYFEELEIEAQNSGSNLIKFLFTGDSEFEEGLCYLQRCKRLCVSSMALEGKDKELMKSMAKVFENCEGQFNDYVYWSVEDEKVEKSRGPMVEVGSPDCCVM